MLFESTITLFDPYWYEYYKLDYPQLWWLIVHENKLPVPFERCGVPFYPRKFLEYWNEGFKDMGLTLPRNSHNCSYTPTRFRYENIFE